jgi:hypothetical protein
MDEMPIEQLEQLAKNPYYVMSQEQLAQLEDYRANKYKPFKKHVSSFEKNSSTFKVNKQEESNG